MRVLLSVLALLAASVVFATAWPAEEHRVRAQATNDCRVRVNVPASCTSSSCRQIARAADGRCVQQGYLEYTPPGYGDETRRPLIVMLHGLAENGDGSADHLRRVTNHGLPELISDNAWPPTPSARDFIVLSPQHRAVGRQSCPTAEEVHAFIEYAKRAYLVDPTRVYLTGLSCGGIGVWRYLAAYPDGAGIAAAISISGDARAAWGQRGCELGRVPTWTFHGARDPGMDVAHVRVPVERLRACTPTPEARLTIYPNAGHNAWTRAYTAREDDIYAWLLTHHR